MTNNIFNITPLLSDEARAREVQRLTRLINKEARAGEWFMSQDYTRQLHDLLSDITSGQLDSFLKTHSER